ncbi:MAG: hypothetical protein KDJ90_18150 [Nitratireductor sp.]|nr:hypothetical protein [Nitratireductor sp.]
MAKSGARAQPKLVRSRLVFNFPGFEGTGPLAQLDRLRHSAQKTGEVWGFSYERASANAIAEESHAISESVTSGTNWQTRTRIVQFSWSDVIESYESEPFPWGLFRNFPKFMTFFADGTVGRYRRASKRYWAFTIFPLLLIAVFAIVCGIAIHFALAAFLVQPPGWALTFVLTLAATLLACRWPGQRLYLLLTINDWGFARDMVNRINPEIEQRYLTFASTLADEIARSRHDEIVIAGHSFGTVWAAGALAVALEKDPRLLSGRNVTFLALGSSLLKIALAPGAGFMRDWMARIIAEPDLTWHEIQTKDDLIAFYKADPFAELGITGIKATLKIDRVKYKEAMNRRRYRQMLRSPYRTHRQYILYQDRRVFFDYVLRLFGPLPARDLALDPGLIDKIGQDGALAGAPPRKTNKSGAAK